MLRKLNTNKMILSLLFYHSFHNCIGFTYHNIVQIVSRLH